MPSSLLNPLEDIMIGNYAGWLLSFYVDGVEQSVLEIGSDEYHAEIEASLPSGLEGGAYKFVIEGMTDDHYRKIAQTRDDDASATGGLAAALPGASSARPKHVRLFLYWLDTNASVAGYVKNLAGLTDTVGEVKGKDIPQALVADLAITSVSRKAGERRYEATVEASEKVFQQLSTRICRHPVFSNPLVAAQTIAEAHGANVTTYPLEEGNDQAEAGEHSGTEEVQAVKGLTAAETVKKFCAQLEQASGRHYGRGLLLIRDGVLHIGARRIPLIDEQNTTDEPKDLDLSGGLIEVESLAKVSTDDKFDICPKENGAPRETPLPEPPKRRQFKLTLKGRSDIKPGAVVRFDSPPEEVSATLPNWTGVVGDLFGGPLVPALGGEFENPVLLYVAAVNHKLGRKTSFVTIVTGVELIEGESEWDEHTRQHEEEDPDESCSDGTSEGRVARAVASMTRAAANTKAFPEVGEVRQVSTEGSEEPPSQSETVWRGLAPSDGRGNRSRRLAVQRPSPAPVNGVPYASPFAWGKCGLVLPRYPGTRVLLTHRHGESDDPIDIGALWESGHGPDSQPGDYWLILPVDVAQAQRATLAEEATPQEHTGKVTQDLTDAEGNRVIEIGQLTIRVGSNVLQDAGTRPASGKNDSLDGTQIVIGTDGSVLIKTKDKNIELDAGNGDITLKAKNVNVEVSGAMDVK